jgi:hypothetical protein
MMRFPLRAEARKVPLLKVSKVSSPLASVRCPLFLRSEIVDALDGNFLGDFEDLANDCRDRFSAFPLRPSRWRSDG